MCVAVYLIAVFGFLGGCTNSNGGRVAQLADKTMEYSLDGGQYAVVVTMDGISVSEARRKARQRAAEITVAQGNRYFTIDAEEQTQVIKSEDIPENQRFYGNLYHELIIERDFGRDRFENQSIPTSSVYSAIRLVFTSYPTKPSYKALDACTLTKCD
jgi:hypothetical protein